MMLCQHCGFEHPDGTRRCPRTSSLMDIPGLCGQKVDRYQVVSLLGLGGFGAVYRAVHSRTGAKVALKVLKKDRASDADTVERFMREARALSGIGNQHIVRVHDADVSAEGVPFIAMEMLEGLNLQELDEKFGPLRPERIVRIMVQVLEGLAAAHDQNVVHRDMKPANVFVTTTRDSTGHERDFVKLLDFGISKMANQKALTMVGTALGTPNYMAYEQFFDASTVDARADIYSVAAMMYELLGRRKPFLAESYGDLLKKIGSETPPPLRELVPQLPFALTSVVEKGLKKNKDERWPTAREFAAALLSVGPMRGVELKTEINAPAITELPVGSPLLPARRAMVTTTEPSGPAAKPVRVDDRTMLMPPPPSVGASSGPIPQLQVTNSQERPTELGNLTMLGPRPSPMVPPRDSAVMAGGLTSRWPQVVVAIGVLVIIAGLLFIALH